MNPGYTAAGEHAYQKKYEHMQYEANTFSS